MNPEEHEHWQVLRELGDESARAGDHVAATRLYTGALQQCPIGQSYVLLAKRSGALLAGGRVRESLAQALRDAVRCVEIVPSWAGGHVCLANAWIAAGQNGKARSAVERGLQADR